MKYSNPEIPMTEDIQPQTDMNPELDELVEGNGPDDGTNSPQTDLEDVPEANAPAGSEPEELESNGSSQTEAESTKKPRRRKAVQSQSDAEETSAAEKPEGAKKTSRKRPYTKPDFTVISIDERPSVETEADKAKNDLLDLLESQKTGRILTGTIQGIERQGDSGRSLAVLYHGDFKVIIPATEAVDPPADFRGRDPDEVMHYLLSKRMGAEVDYIVKGIDPKTGLAVGSRLEAMRAKRKEYYLGTDRDGNNLLYSGACAEARVVSVIRAGIFVDLFGLEIYIPLRELSYQRMLDAAVHYQPGQRILVKVLDVDRSDRNQIKATASVKQAGENPYEKALRKYTVGNRYVGTVSMVDTNGVFVALDGGIDCLCSYPKRGRPPRGARVTVRILGINHESNRIWGAITHIAAAR